MPDWTAIRQEFPILDQNVGGNPLIYFDSAASSQKPRAVIQALVDFYSRDNANVHRGLHELSSRATIAFEAAREKAARFLGATSEDEIIFTRGTTEGINLVASTWAEHFLHQGDVILLTELEHHSNLVPWQLAAQKSGATLRFVPVLPDGSLDLEKLDTLLTEEVKIFAFTHASNSVGTMTPAREWCAKARKLGVTTLLDGAQTAGHLPVNVSDLQCDFYVCSGHKMVAPTGIGLLYGRKEVLSKMPPWHGGGEMIVTVGWEQSTYREAPMRFEAGTPNIAGAIVLGAALDFLENIGRAEIQVHDAELTRHAWNVLGELPGIRRLGPDIAEPRAALVSFVLESVHPHDLVTYANEKGLALRGGHHCTMPLMKKLKLPGGSARASFYFYNTKEEIDRMGEILRQAIKFFG